MRLGSLPVACLVAGAVLTGIVAHFVTVAIAPWIMLALLLRAARTLPARWSLAALGVALYAALAIGNRGVIPVPGLPYFLVILGVTLGTLAPFVVDRFVGQQLSQRLPAASTLVFPIAWVSVELVNARFTPSATWGWIGYTQFGNLPLMQLSAFTGLAGIAFLIAWFASVANEAWARGFAATRRLLALYAAILGLVLLGGAMRLNLAPSPLHHIRAAVVSFPPDILAPGEPTRVAEGRVGGGGDPVRSKLARLQQYFLDTSDREARAGAELVAWPETNLLVLAEDESAFLDRARALAVGRRVNLVMGMGTIHLGAPKPLENKAVFVDDTGVLRFSYRKTHPVIGWEQGIMIPGDGHLPLADAEFGRLTSAVCFDADFAGFMRQIGRAGADLWVVPANDWPEIKRMHLAMAAFRAVENGVPMLRPASRGVSAAVDAWGRVLGETDHAGGAMTLVVEIPIGHVPTLYSRIGDLFAWLCVVGLAAAIVGRLGLRSRGSKATLEYDLDHATVGERTPYGS